MDQMVIIEYLSRYQLIAVFFGSIFFGELIIIPAIILSAEGIFSPIGVFVASLLGTVVADLGWYSLGRQGIDFLSRFSRRIRARYTRYIERVEHQDERHRVLFLLFFKFAYGIRILTIIYLSLHRMPIRRFLVFTTLGSALWLTVAFLIGWPAWQVASRYIPSLDSLSYIALGSLLAIVIIHVCIKWIGKLIVRK